jgi:membrane-associated HD superfamily phosphohydrolase
LPDRWKNSRRVRLLLYVGLGIFCYLLLLEQVFPQQISDLSPGKVASETIVSPVTKVDQVATDQAREQAAQSVGKQYRIDEQLTERQVTRLDTLFDRIRKTLSDSSLNDEEK